MAWLPRCRRLSKTIHLVAMFSCFVFRGRGGNVIKALWSTGDGLCLLAKPLEHGRFVWPQPDSGNVHLTAAELSMLLEGSTWTQSERTWPSISVL
jgi:transposase